MIKYMKIIWIKKIIYIYMRLRRFKDFGLNEGFETFDGIYWKVWVFSKEFLEVALASIGMKSSQYW